MNKEQAELSKLSETFASELAKLKKVIASDSVTSDSNSQLRDCMNAIYSVADNLHNRMDRMSASMYAYQDSHSTGHLPPIVGAGKMNKALASLGLDEDFEASKKTIYASKDLFNVVGLKNSK